jgi:hypothetical protein
MGITEVAYYARFEAGFEAFPAENYVDYMTNVMPIPERHFFYIPKRGLAIVCEVRKSEVTRLLEWRLSVYESFPSNSLELSLEPEKIEEMFTSLDDLDSPRKCGKCVEYLGSWLKFF